MRLNPGTQITGSSPQWAPEDAPCRTRNEPFRLAHKAEAALPHPSLHFVSAASCPSSQDHLGAMARSSCHGMESVSRLRGVSMQHKITGVRPGPP